MLIWIDRAAQKKGGNENGDTQLRSTASSSRPTCRRVFGTASNRWSCDSTRRMPRFWRETLPAPTRNARSSTASNRWTVSGLTIAVKVRRNRCRSVCGHSGRARDEYGFHPQRLLPVKLSFHFSGGKRVPRHSARHVEDSILVIPVAFSIVGRRREFFASQAHRRSATCYRELRGFAQKLSK